MGIARSFARLKQALGLESWEASLEEASVNVVAPLPMALGQVFRFSDTAVTTNSAASTVIETFTLTEPGLYGFMGTASLETAVAAATRVRLQLLGEGGTGNPVFQIESALFGAGDTDVFGPLVFWLSKDWVLRIILIDATGVGESVASSMSVWQYLQE